MKKRIKRFNENDIFIMMYTENKNIPVAFEGIPYKRKVRFKSFPTDYKSSMYIDFYKNTSLKVKDFWKIILGMASGGYPYYDPWKLLLDGNLKKD